MSTVKLIARGIAVAISIALVGVMLLWLVTVTGGGTAAAAGSASAAIMNKFDMYVNNASASALDGIVPIKKVYRLEENLVVAPEPDQSLFGITSDVTELDTVIESASELLDGQDTVFNSDITLRPGSKVRYYLDDTILAITWKEAINGAIYTFSEVKIADPSQFRRYLADNSFGSSVQYMPSDMAKSVNAVVAINGDFYKFRNMGIVVYQRQVYRVEGDKVDTCFIDTNGDLNFVRAGEITDWAAAEAYVAENDILFSLAFGPVLVENGVACQPAAYPIGEINQNYSRSAIAQLGELHYLLVAVSFEDGYINAATITGLAKELESRGVDKAYTLDGGQTATIIMNDEVINNVDFGYQRNISDIVYFATALPD